MAADEIAKVVADLRDRRVRLTDPRGTGIARRAVGLVQSPAVVDCTGIYESLVARDEPVYVYEDHPSIAPPWQEAAFCYRNEWGNVVVMHAVVGALRSRWRSQAETHTIDWDDVRWTLDVFVWLGGRSAELGRPIPTMGPAHLWRMAIAADGTPIDLHWVHLVEEYPLEHWDMAHLTILGALNFLNCRNVDIVEPDRSRPLRRRIQRTGVRVHEITVFPTGRTSRVKRGSQAGGAGVPLSSVRGHFAHYGDCCPGQHEPRGLAFGRIEGRFWIPQHARGTADAGETDVSYRLEVQP